MARFINFDSPDQEVEQLCEDIFKKILQLEGMVYTVKQRQNYHMLEVLDDHLLQVLTRMNDLLTQES